MDDNYCRIFQIDLSTFNIEILEITIDEEYRSVKDSYIRTGECFLLFFDLNCKDDLSYFDTEIENIIRLKDQDYIPMILVGTKCDLVEGYPTRHIEVFCTKHHIPYILTSSKSHINVEETFVMAFQEIINFRMKISKEIKDEKSNKK